MSKTQTLELPIFSNRALEASATDDAYLALRQRHEAKKRKFDLLKYLKVGGAIAVTAAGGAWYNSANSTHTSKITETVRPHEMAWNVAVRAERDAGVDLNSVDITRVVDKLTARYGDDLQPGQKVVVPVETH